MKYPTPEETLAMLKTWDAEYKQAVKSASLFGGMDDPTYEQYWRMWEKYEDCLSKLIGAEQKSADLNHDSFLSSYRASDDLGHLDLEFLCDVICKARNV
jgi:hypothetical protein